MQWRPKGSRINTTEPTPFAHTSIITKSNPFDGPPHLIEGARTVILGGKANKKTGRLTVKKNKGRFQNANIFLNAADDLTDLRILQRQYSSTRTPRELLSRFINHGDAVQSLHCGYRDLRLVRDILQMRCQILGRKWDFDGVIDHAEVLLDLENVLKQEPRANPTDAATMISIAHGYKGVALSMKKSWDTAYPCLSKSYNMHHESLHSEHASSSKCRRTRLDQYREEEAAAIEHALVTCCRNMGREPPIPPFTCFPRTAHLFDTGGTAVSNDDLVISRNSLLFCEFGNGTTEVVVEEKIDGANLGFSLSATGEILAQNRSHYVSEGDHRQFGRLKSWINEHRSSLTTVLTPPDYIQRAAGQGLILFGMLPVLVSLKRFLPFATRSSQCYFVALCNCR
mmetsp:Transcript_20495/g.44597  ORF Transcript_20495/g.44597 Transcript_20495/m.44597 type:complete len:397 (-) Transcript_20495:525-1715(-)